MAKFKDSPLKQIVDDLNFQNADTIPAPLTVEQCTLLNVEDDPSATAPLNTKATLRVAASADYPAGDLRIRYRRLLLDTLLTGIDKNVVFLGPSLQTKSTAEIVTALAPSLAPYILPEIESASFDLTRDNTIVNLTPKADSEVLAPETLTLNVATGAVNLNSFQFKEGINVYSSQLPFPTYNEDIPQFVLDRIRLANQQSAALSKDDVSIQILPGTGSQSYAQRRIRVTVTTPDLYYTGSADFMYNLADMQAQLSDDGSYANVAFTTGQTQAGVLDPLFQARNKYFRASEIVPGVPIKPVRASDFSNSYDYTHVFANPQSLIYGSGFDQSPNQFKFLTTDLFPFEEIIEFVVTTPGVRKLFTTTNTSTMPVTIELQAKPAAFAPTTLDVDGSFTTTQSLPVGTYRIRITRPDSYRTPLIHHQYNNSNTTEISPSRILKVKAHDMSYMFAYCLDPMTIDAGAFDTATQCYKAGHLFDGTNKLASLPDHIFDKMIAVYDWVSALSGTTMLSVVPDELFGFITAYLPGISNLFYGAGPEVIPTNLFKNAGYLQLGGVFQQSVNTKTISPGFIAAMNLKKYTPYFSDMFTGCSSLQAIPADFFVGVIPRTYNFGVPPYNGDWDLSGMFRNCTALTALPGTLLQSLLIPGYDTLNLSDMFAGCTALASIPQGFLDGVKFGQQQGMQGTFWGCTALTTIRGDLFRTTQLKEALGVVGGSSSRGTFEGSGITAIPADLFQGNEAYLKGAVLTFANTKVTSVPGNLFAGCTECKDVRHFFRSCALLNSVPANFFAGLSACEWTEGVFRECAALTSIPAGLFDPLVAVKKAPYMFWNAGLTSFPDGLFATMVALQQVTGIFQNCPIAQTVDNVFTNQPALTEADSVFAGTKVTIAGPSVFFSAPEVTTVASLFSGCQQLTQVHGNMLQGQTKLLNANAMFMNTLVLPVVPSTLFSQCPLLNNVSFLFAGATGLLSIPQDLFTQNPQITNLTYFANGATALNTVPAGLFNGLTQVTSASNLFTNCTTVPAVPANLFKDFAVCRYFDNAFSGCTALATIGANLFAENTQSASLVSMFSDCPALTTVPDGIFFNLKNISSLRMAFMNCPGLTTVGRLVANTMSPKIEIGGLLGGDLLGTGGVYPDFAVADNLIDSTVPLNIGAYGFVLPFNRRSNWTKNITNLFGANCKFEIASYETKGYFAGMKLTGAGIPFIAKHQVPTTTTGFFTGTTTLSDYATLPAWAKS